MQIQEPVQHFNLSEYEEKLIEVLDSEVAIKIQETGIVELSRKVSGEFVLRADSKVGFVSAQGVQVNVRPRFPIYNVFYFLGLVKELRFKDEKVFIDENTDFLTLLFQSFLHSVDAAISKGLMSGYVNVEETSQVLRGRINFNAQLKRHIGNLFPFEITYDDFKEDIPENQLLKKALQISLKYGLNNQLLRNRAQSLLFNFKEVSDIQISPVWNESRLNKHYWDALKLATLIISGNGFHEGVGNTAINGFSIDMYKVFEDFVANELTSRINGRLDSISTHKSLALDSENIYQVKPDIIWYRNSKPFRVMDTKYKKPEGETQQRDSLDDLRQVISYASLLGLKEAHLIYGVAGKTRTIQTRQEGIIVSTYGLDLGQTPENIHAQLDALVQNMGISA